MDAVGDVILNYALFGALALIVGASIVVASMAVGGNKWARDWLESWVDEAQDLYRSCSQATKRIFKR